MEIRTIKRELEQAITTIPHSFSESRLPDKEYLTRQFLNNKWKSITLANRVPSKEAQVVGQSFKKFGIYPT